MGLNFYREGMEGHPTWQLGLQETFEREASHTMSGLDPGSAPSSPLLPPSPEPRLGLNAGPCEGTGTEVLVAESPRKPSSLGRAGAPESDQRELHRRPGDRGQSWRSHQERG